MKRVMFATVAFLLLFAKGVMANEENYLSIGDVNLIPGTTVNLPIEMINSDPLICAFQFTLVLPDNVGVKVDEKKKKPAVKLSEDRIVDHVISSNLTMEKNQRVLKVIVFSLTNALIAGKKGTIVNIPLEVKKEAKSSECTFELRNVVLAKKDNSDISPATTIKQLKIKGKSEAKK